MTATVKATRTMNAVEINGSEAAFDVVKREVTIEPGNGQVRPGDFRNCRNPKSRRIGSAGYQEYIVAPVEAPYAPKFGYRQPMLETLRFLGNGRVSRDGLTTASQVASRDFAAG